MMQNLLINSPFTGEPASASQLFHRAPATSPPFPSLKGLSLCCVAEHLSIETGIKMPTRPLHEHTHTQPDAHQHQACCCLTPTETHPVFVAACLLLKACSEPLKAMQIEQKGNLWIKLFRDRCSLTVGRRVGRFGEAMLPGAVCQPAFLACPETIHPWRGQRGFPYSPLTGVSLVPWGPLLPPLFLPSCPRLEKHSTTIATWYFVAPGICTESFTVGGCSTR